MKIYKHSFDSTDFNSVIKEIEIINEAGGMLFAETTDGETIVFDVISAPDEIFGYRDVLKTAVFQKNGWIRINTYDPISGEVTENYKKEF